MFGEYRAILQQDELEDPEIVGLLPKDSPLHIYMIGRRPRIAIDPGSLKIDEDTFSGVFTIQNQHTYERVEFSLGNQIGVGPCQISCAYPYTELALLAPDGTSALHGKAAALMMNCGPGYWKYLDLEVLYVGQAYGEGGSRLAPERLRAHSTLQKIYVDAMRRSPDKDIWIVLWSFRPKLIVSMGGRQWGIAASEKEDKEHHDRVTRCEITEEQRINFTEAALIRYFQPEYNIMLRDSFPSPHHKSYSQCYEIELNAVVVELQTEFIGTRLWSPAVPARFIHFIRYDLHSREERKSMFDFST